MTGEMTHEVQIELAEMENVMKNIPEHIVPKWDPNILKFGMWNERLAQWVGRDPDFGHPFFDSELEARDWYREQI